MRTSAPIKNVKIPINTAISSEITISDFAFAMLGMPAAMTGANIRFKVRTEEDGDLLPLVDSTTGSRISITFTASSACRLPDELFGCYSFVLDSDATELAEAVFGLHAVG